MIVIYQSKLLNQRCNLIKVQRSLHKALFLISTDWSLLRLAKGGDLWW